MKLKTFIRVIEYGWSMFLTNSFCTRTEIIMVCYHILLERENNYPSEIVMRYLSTIRLSLRRSNLKNSYNRNPRKQNKPKVIKQTLSLLTILLALVILLPNLIVNSSELKSLFTNSSSSLFTKIKLTTASKSEIPPSSKESLSNSVLRLGWVAGNKITTNSLAQYQGLNIVSPTIGIIDKQIHLIVNTKPLLIKNLHKQNKRVWTLITMEQNSKQAIHQLLSNPVKYDALIKSMNQSAYQNHWDGINLDIENVSSQDRNAFSQFIKSLSSVLHQSHVILSIDIPPDQRGVNDHAPFDHQVLGQYCDYIAFMGYDEH